MMQLQFCIHFCLSQAWYRPWTVPAPWLARAVIATTVVCPRATLNTCPGSPSPSWLELWKRVAASHKRNVIIGGCVSERSKKSKKKKTNNFITWNEAQTTEPEKCLQKHSRKNTKADRYADSCTFRISLTDWTRFLPLLGRLRLCSEYFGCASSRSGDEPRGRSMLHVKALRPNFLNATVRKQQICPQAHGNEEKHAQSLIIPVFLLPIISFLRVICTFLVPCFPTIVHTRGLANRGSHVYLRS
jgi:hypothetical protein